MSTKVYSLLIFLPLMMNTEYAVSQSTLELLYPPENTIVEYHTEWTKNHYRGRIKEFKEHPLSLGDIVFIGNSITENGKDWGAKLGVENVKNRGISGDVTDGVLLRLGELIKYKPTSIFIMIGINDLFNLHYQKEIPSPNYIIKNLLKIMTLLHEKLPNTQIYFQTLLPTARDFINRNVNIVNSAMRSHQSNGTYCLIDLNPHFTTKNGLIRASLTYDGTHLNKKGYKLWASIIKPYLSQK